MKHEYTVTGMTCNNCVASVKEKLSKVDHITNVDVDLETNKAELTMNQHIDINTLQTALPDKYSIQETNSSTKSFQPIETVEPSKLQQLKPLFFILGYIFAASFLLNWQPMNWNSFMLDYMGLFFIVFSFFKLLDLKGFPSSFQMYDPLAKAVPVYAHIYPFIETALGLAFLMRFQIKWVLIVTIILLGITTVGVTKSLFNKRAIRCACLGTALNLPMTEATFIENAIMIVMSVIMLITLL